jgi:hypothetical protein
MNPNPLLRIGPYNFFEMGMVSGQDLGGTPGRGKLSVHYSATLPFSH